MPYFKGTDCLNLERKIKAEFGLTIKVAYEIEFYLPNLYNDILALILLGMKQEDMPFKAMEEEEGEGQYEISLTPADPKTALVEIIKLKEILTKAGALLNTQPFPDRAFSGMHFNFSLFDEDGKNIFVKTDSEENELTMNIIGGLCDLMVPSILCYLPEPKDMTRLFWQTNLDKGFETCYSLPTTISWGGNNRTTTLRFPEATIFPEGRHLEHRLASSSARPEDVMFATFAGIYHGLKNKLKDKAPAKCFGLAYDKQYDHEFLPYEHSKAKELFDLEAFLD